MKKLIPTCLILGPLGSGKTTTVLELLKASPAGERWAVFINEFGSVSLDDDIVRGKAEVSAELIIRETHGGCICCNRSDDLFEGLRSLIEEQSPDRLFIEPTGLADANSLVEALQSGGRDLGLRIHSVIGHLDARILRRAGALEMPYWHSLANCCDHIVVTKAELVGDDESGHLQELVGQPAFEGVRFHFGRDTLPEFVWEPCPDAGIRKWIPVQQGVAAPFRKSSDGHRAGAYSESSISFDTGMYIDLRDLEKWINQIRNRSTGLVRLKGIARTREGSFLVQVAGDDPVEYRTIQSSGESRFQAIFRSGDFSWDGFQRLWRSVSPTLVAKGA